MKMKEKERIDELSKRVLSGMGKLKSPVIIELSGTPKAGKTTCLLALETLFRRNGFRVKTIYEKSPTCPIKDKEGPLFNLWTLCQVMEEVMTCTKQACDIVLIDRGLWDALSWFQYFSDQKVLPPGDMIAIEDFISLKSFGFCYYYAFVFLLPPSMAVMRAQRHELTLEKGRIVNEASLSSINKAINKRLNCQKPDFITRYVVPCEKQSSMYVNQKVARMILEVIEKVAR